MEQGGKNFIIARKYSEEVTLANTGDLVGLVGHGLKAGTRVVLRAIVTATGPSIDTDYYVRNPGADNFQLAATPGGSAVEITLDGTGTLEVFKRVGGARSKGLSLNSEAIDITNDDSEEFREILDGAGIRQMSLSLSGVFEDGDVYNDVLQDLMQNRLADFRFVSTKPTAAGEVTYFDGTFKVTSLEQNGEYNGEAQYSLSFESSGEVTFEKEAA